MTPQPPPPHTPTAPRPGFLRDLGASLLALVAFAVPLWYGLGLAIAFVLFPAAGAGASVFLLVPAIFLGSGVAAFAAWCWAAASLRRRAARQVAVSGRAPAWPLLGYPLAALAAVGVYARLHRTPPRPAPQAAPQGTAAQATSMPAPRPVATPSHVQPASVRRYTLSTTELARAEAEMPWLFGPLLCPGATIDPDFVSREGHTFREGDGKTSPLYPSVLLVPPDAFGPATLERVAGYYEGGVPGGKRRPDGTYVVDTVRRGDGARVRVLVVRPRRGPNPGRVGIVLMSAPPAGASP